MVLLFFHQEWAVMNAHTPRASILLACLELGSALNVRMGFWCWTQRQVPSGRWPATNAMWLCTSLRMPTRSECRRRPATCAMQPLWMSILTKPNLLYLGMRPSIQAVCSVIPCFKIWLSWSMQPWGTPCTVGDKEKGKAEEEVKAGGLEEDSIQRNLRTKWQLWLLTLYNGHTTEK